eukprot:2028659-Pleurochrysis_carterae.AAC.1
MASILSSCGRHDLRGTLRRSSSSSSRDHTNPRRMFQQSHLLSDHFELSQSLRVGQMIPLVIADMQEKVPDLAAVKKEEEA